MKTKPGFSRLLLRALFLLALPPVITWAQPFTDIGAGLVAFSKATSSWGDYDNDGDLDILMTGHAAGIGASSKIYRNDGGTFVSVAAGLVGVYEGYSAWGDYDSDGDLDILLTGRDGIGNPITEVYRNDGGLFSAISGLIGVKSSSAAWGDFENDGDLDILLTGRGASGGPIGMIYLNEAGSFLESTGPQAVHSSSVAWGDYDNDGDLDFLITGITSLGYTVSQLYRNEGGGSITGVGPAGVVGVKHSSVAWGDYDNDGDLDLLITGISWLDDPVSIVHRNDEGALTDISAGLPGVSSSAVAWGDYDNDRDLDIILGGTNQFGDPICLIYRNDGGTFIDISAGLASLFDPSVAWGDYDNDGDLDLLITGLSATGTARSIIYRNDLITGSFAANTPPNPVSNLMGSPQTATSVLFNWDSGTDAQTPTNGLSYRLWIGTTPGGIEVSSPMADTATGWRRIAAIGDIQDTSWTLKDMIPGQTYFACVSTIDGGLMGGNCSNSISIMSIGTEDPRQPLIVTVGPNPSSDFAHVRVNQTLNQPIQYQLLDAQCQRISGRLGTMTQDFRLDLSGLASGIYFLHLSSERMGAHLLKIIKE